jgi:ABC-type tungstate transport system substrate-binding protein
LILPLSIASNFSALVDARRRNRMAEKLIRELGMQEVEHRNTVLCEGVGAVFAVLTTAFF